MREDSQRKSRLPGRPHKPDGSLRAAPAEAAPHRDKGSSRVAPADDLHAAQENPRPYSADLQAPHSAPFDPFDVRSSTVVEGKPSREEGQAQGVVAPFDDLTRLQQTDERTRRLAAVVTDSNDAVILFDLQGGIRAWNRGAQAVYGWTENEALQMSVQDIWPADGPAARTNLVRRLCAGEAVPSFETKRLTKDGRVLDVWMTVTALRDERGQVTEIAATERDITERKRDEEALRHLNEQLEQRVTAQTGELRASYEAAKAERQRLYAVLETLPVYVVLMSPDHQVPFANKFFRDRFGESGGKRCFEYLFQRSTPCADCESFKVLATGQPHHWFWTGPDGRDYDIHDFPFTDADGSLMVMEMGIDVTDARKAQAAMWRMNEQLEQRVAERTAELTATNEDLTRLNSAMVGRELRMIELKKEVNEACVKAGRPPVYPIRDG